MCKERELNDSPQDKINPDEVRLNKLENIVETYYETYKRESISSIGGVKDIGWTLEVCLGSINCENEKYTPKEIKDALLEWFYYDDVIEFLLEDYLGALQPKEETLADIIENCRQLAEQTNKNLKWISNFFDKRRLG